MSWRGVRGGVPLPRYLPPRRLQRGKIDCAQADIDALTTSLDAHGIKLSLTDEEFATMKRMAEAAGPEGMERFRKMAKKAGREV